MNITFPERVIVENIILRNVIMNKSAAEIDNHIRRDGIIDYNLSGNVIFISSFQTKHQNSK